MFGRLWQWLLFRMGLSKTVVFLDPGKLAFDVSVNGKVTRWDADLITLKLIAENLQRKHKLPEINGMIHATPVFLVELASEFVRDGGCPACDETQACSVWQIVNRRFNKLDDNMRANFKRLKI